MTVTERRLLGGARRGRLVVVHGYRVGKGRPRRYGGRDVDAACRLLGRGLVRLVSQQSYRECRNAYSDHWTETVYEVIDR